MEMDVDRKWIAILMAYAILLVLMGFIAFFHLDYNPVTSIGKEELALLADQHAKGLIEQALREESKAFQMKRDLAIQSFNIILGAALGFLSAAVYTKKERNSEGREPNPSHPAE